MRGFASTEDIERLANALGGCVRVISSHMDLSRLDGFTVAYDYDAALAELDGGVDGLRPLARCNDDRLTGIGMAPAVLRNGVVKIHVVLDARHVEGIDQRGGDGPSEALLAALAVLAHECAHVQVTGEKDAAFPGEILQRRVSDYVEGVFRPIADACWDEYAACRLAAPYGRSRLGDYERGLRGVLETCRPRAATARTGFRTHRDLGRVVVERGTSLSEPLRMASYLPGHIDSYPEPTGMRGETTRAIAEAGYGDLIDELGRLLRDLWSTQPHWSHADFDRLGDLAGRAFRSGGLLVEHRDAFLMSRLGASRLGARVLGISVKRTSFV